MSERNAKVLRRYVRAAKPDEQTVRDIRYILESGTAEQKSFVTDRMRSVMPELYSKREVRRLANRIITGRVKPNDHYTGWRKEFNPQ
jgi:hypothetical protein